MKTCKSEEVSSVVHVLWTSEVNLCKNDDHRWFFAKVKLFSVIETNPGPPINNVDPTLTIKAPYSQGDITAFGANAGQQCIAMSLCALIYNLSKE